MCLNGAVAKVFAWYLVVSPTAPGSNLSQFRYFGCFVSISVSSFSSKLNLSSKFIVENFRRFCPDWPRHLCGKVNALPLYKSLIVPHIDYCSTVLFLLSDPQINDLQKIQNRCMCLILKVNGRTHIKDMLDMLQWNSVKQRIYCNALKFIHRIKQGNVAEALTEKMDTRKEIHKRNLRSNDSFHLPSAKKSSTQNCLMYKGLKMYNDFLSKITENGPNGAKQKLK